MNYLKNLKEGGDQPPQEDTKDTNNDNEDAKPLPAADLNKVEDSKIETGKIKDKFFTPVLGNRMNKQLPPLIRKKGVFLIGICGGPSCGKTTLVDHIKMNLGRSVKCIKWSDFYKPLLGKGGANSLDGLDDELEQIDTEEDHKTAVAKINKLYDFDSPDAIEFDLLIQVLKELKDNKSTTKPKYNKKTKMREESWVTVNPCDVIIVEGHLVFANKELLEMFDQKIYIDADDDIRLTRRILKEKKEAEKDGEFDIIKCLDKYEKFVKPAYDKYVEPTKKYADMVIPNNVQSELDNESMTPKEKSCLAINRSMLIIWNVAEKVCDFVNERY